MLRALVFLFLGALTAGAASPVSTNTGDVLVAGVQLPVAGLKVLCADISANSSTFYNCSPGAVTRAVYQVPAGKTFDLYAVKWEQYTATGIAIGNRLVYTTTNGGLNSAAGSSPIGMITGVASGNNADCYSTTALTGGGPVARERFIGGTAPQNTFPTVTLGGSKELIQLFGYER